LTADESAIRAVVADFIEAYNQGDWDRMQHVLADDVVDMSGGSVTRVGQAARAFFRSRVEAAHARNRPTLSVTIDELQVCGDWAFDRGSLVVELKPRDGGEVTHIRQRFLEIWKRNAGGRWQVCRIMDNEDGSGQSTAELPR
jgi:ketosteroid isomerase-like protein